MYSVSIFIFSNVMTHGKILTQEAKFGSKYIQVFIMNSET